MKTKKHLLPFALGFAAAFAVATAFGTGDGAPVGPEDNGVVLGEEDLAERAEILRNLYRRITPPEISLVQDIGTWPAAWEEFGANWDAAAVDREYGAWVVPVEVTQDAGATVVKDGNGAVLWRGWTDFARPESADVVLTGGLVAEEDWDIYEGIRDAVERFETTGGTPAPPARTDEPSGLRFTGHEWTADDTFRLELAYETDTNVDIFAYAVLHASNVVDVTWTNDENVVVSNRCTNWYSLGPPLEGKTNAWEWRGTVAISNGVAEFEDSGFSEELARLRFYATAVAEDTDGDGLNDGMEIFVSHTDPYLTDTDGDGIDDATEHAAGSNPSRSNVWWMATTTNEIRYWAHMGNQPSWSDTPYQQFETNVVSSLTNCVRILKDVRIDGFVDDIIRIDSFEVNENQGPKSFTNQSITNVSPFLDCGSLDLTLFDCPAHGHSGHNEIRLGDTNNNPFRVMWDWQVSIDIRMEPIWTSETLPLDNPCGIILGSNAWFHVEVFPEGGVPEEQIVWEAQGGKLEFVTTNTGSRVEVCATNAGDATLCVEVQGTVGDFGLPPFHVKVMPLTVVTTRVGVVVTTNGEWVVSSNRVQQIIDEANRVLLQAGIQLKCESPIPINDVLGYENIIVGSLEHNILIGSLPAQGKMEIYFVGTITHDLGIATGCYNPNGVLIATNGTGRTLGHEVCHAFGLRDIYLRWKDVDVVMTGPVQENWMPYDWGNYRTETSNIPADVEGVMPRLLMFGKNQPDKGDIASGTVYGLTWEGAGTNITWSLQHQAVGLSGMTNSPVH